MASVTTVTATDAHLECSDNDVCPDCGLSYNDTCDAGCETCEDSHDYDNCPDWCGDVRRNAWDDRPSWAGDFGYEG